MVVCPNFGHPAQTSSLKKYKSFEEKNISATIVNEPSVLKLFQLSSVDLFFSDYAYSICKVRKTRMTKFWQGVRSYCTLPF